MPETAGTIMRNLDHEWINGALAERLRDDPTLWAQHAAWEFCGYVRWDAHATEWIEEVWRYHEPIATHRASTLDELRVIVNDNHGWD
jgi:hypothetical protein